jgi:hypothetical protein
LVVVGHFDGGLVARHYLDRLGGWRQARALVAIATPFRGLPARSSQLPGGDLGQLVAHLAGLPSWRELAAGSPFLTGLADAARRGAGHVCAIVGVGAVSDGEDGDGVVPASSAAPADDPGLVEVAKLSRPHASITSAAEALAAVTRAVRGQEASPQSPVRRAYLSLELSQKAGSVQLSVAPSRPLLWLRATVADADRPLRAPRVLDLTVAGPKLIGTLGDVGVGNYRVTFYGGADVEPATDLFALLPEHEPQWGPIRAVRRPEDSSGTYRGGGTLYTLKDPPPRPPRETVTVERYPSIRPLGPVRPGERLEVEVDLPSSGPDPATSGTFSVRDIDAAWESLPVRVVLSGSALSPDHEPPRGQITLHRDGSSTAVRFSIVVARPADGGSLFELRASFYYDGRLCGQARRALALEARETASPEGAGTVGAAVIERGVEAPVLTIEMYRHDPATPGRLHWIWNVTRACEGLPRRLDGWVELGSKPEEFAASIARQAIEIAPGDHVRFLESAGRLLYEKTPPAFQQTYRALRKAFGAGFPIQISTDDPYTAWELMMPDVEGARLMLVDHPIARWLLDHKSTMCPTLRPGRIVTVAPRYDGSRGLDRLDAAENESEGLQRKFGAMGVPGRSREVLDVLGGGLGVPITIFHFAGHGSHHGRSEDSELYLEDRSLRALELRHDSITLGKQHRTLVVLNACEVGTTSEQLGAVGGWPEVLLEREFGGVLAPLWPVRDHDARDVVERVVGAVMKGHSVAEVLRHTRAELGHRSSTYYAYVYVGDVMARLRELVAPTRSSAGAASVPG